MDLFDCMCPYFEYILNSHASSSTGLGIAVIVRPQSPLPTGKGVRGNGFVLTGVLGGLLLVNLVRLILASLGRLL